MYSGKPASPAARGRKHTAVLEMADFPGAGDLRMAGQDLLHQG